MATHGGGENNAGVASGVKRRCIAAASQAVWRGETMSSVIMRGVKRHIAAAAAIGISGKRRRGESGRRQQ